MSTPAITKAIPLKNAENKPEEIVATKQPTVTTEALVAQETPAVGALDACAVPRPAENAEQELVNDRQLAPGTHHHHWSSASVRQ